MVFKGGVLLKDSALEKDIRQTIETNPEYAAEYFQELMKRPMPVQLALLRKFLGMTQEELARALHLKQTHISRLEKAGSDHFLSLYQRAAERLGAHLAIIPDEMAVVSRAYLKRLQSAHA